MCTDLKNRFGTVYAVVDITNLVDGNSRTSVSYDTWKHTLLCLREMCALSRSPTDISVVAVIFSFLPKDCTTCVVSRSLVNRVANDCQSVLGAMLVDGRSNLIVFTNSWNTMGELRRIPGSLDCLDWHEAESVIMYACDRASALHMSDADACLSSH